MPAARRLRLAGCRRDFPQFPVRLIYFPVPPEKFPVRMRREFTRKTLITISIFLRPNGVLGERSAKFPVIFPLSGIGAILDRRQHRERAEWLRGGSNISAGVAKARD